jgi:hypothetical protein
MRKQELHHNTPEQVEQYIRDALGLVAKIHPPADLREAAFAQACALLSGKQIVYEQVAPALPNLAIPRGR